VKGFVVEDISSVVGQTCLTIGGKQAIIDNLGADDWSAFMSETIRRKKKAIVKAAAEISSDMDPESAQQWRRDALREIAGISTLGRADVIAEIAKPEGASLLLWCMLERRYPRKFKEDAILRQIQEDAKLADGVIGVMSSLLLVMGGVQSDQEEEAKGSAGNAEGQPIS